MAKISFSKEFQTKKYARLDKLTLDKGERARVALVGELDAEYVHTLQKVVLDEDTGQLVEESKDGRNGTYTVPVKAYVGKFRCTGEFDAVQDKGGDPNNCPFCQAAQDSGAFDSARRYLVALAFQYETKPGTFTAQTKPFQGKVLPWVFTDGKWDKLADIHEEFEGKGGVYAIDLKLGPCESAMFQNYEIQPAADCTWREQDKWGEYVKEMLESYEGDLKTLFGREATEVEAKRAIREVQDAFDAAYSPSGVKNDRVSSSSSAAVDSLFGGGNNVPEVDTDVDTDDEEDVVETDASGVKSLEEILDL